MKSIKKFLPLLLISGAIAVYFLMNRKPGTPGTGGGGGGLFGNLISGSTTPPAPNITGNDPVNVPNDEIVDLIKTIAPKQFGGTAANVKNGEPLQVAWQKFFDKHHPLTTTA